MILYIYICIYINIESIDRERQRETRPVQKEAEAQEHTNSFVVADVKAATKGRDSGGEEKSSRATKEVGERERRAREREREIHM